jgi:hypothetical protein
MGNKLFEVNPYPTDFNYSSQKRPSHQINVFSLPEKTFLKSFTSIPDFFTENPEMLPDVTLMNYCKTSTYLLFGWGRDVILDAEQFKQKYRRLVNERDVSSVENPRLEGDEVIYFTAQGLDRPMRIMAKRPFFETEAPMVCAALPPVSIPFDQQKI